MSYDHWASSKNTLDENWNGDDVGKQNTLLASFEIVPPQHPPSGFLPRGSLYLSFTFTLAGPYISKDDRPFHSVVPENPIRREWAFWVPMVSGSTWKGNMRSAALALTQAEGNRKDWHKYEEKLFGPRMEKGKDEIENPRQGRVQFFPTYFDKIADDIINPRNRSKRTGSKLIRMEQVPAGKKGRFAILYIPFDLLHLPDAELQITKDLRLLGTSIAETLRISGFGGKKTLPNHGTALDEIESVILADENGVIKKDEKLKASDLWQLPEFAKRKA